MIAITWIKMRAHIAAALSSHYSHRFVTRLALALLSAFFIAVFLFSFSLSFVLLSLDNAANFGSSHFPLVCAPCVAFFHYL